MFLLEKLPKDNTQSTDEPTGADILLSRSIAAEMNTYLKLPWTPSFCVSKSIRWTGPSTWVTQVSETRQNILPSVVSVLVNNDINVAAGFSGPPL